MFPEEKRMDYREFLAANAEALSQLRDKFSEEDRVAFRNFIVSNEALQECGTISSNLKVPTNVDSKIHDTDEMSDFEDERTVKKIEVDKVEDTGDDERHGNEGIKYGASRPSGK